MKYRKKPIVVEAELYKEGMEDGFDFCELFSGKVICSMTHKQMEYELWPKTDRKPFILTLEGKMRISEGDYIITGVKGERYPCKPDIFHATYEPVK